MAFRLTSSYTPQNDTSDFIHPELVRLWLVRGVQLLAPEQKREILSAISDPHTVIRSALGITHFVAEDVAAMGDVFGELLADLEARSNLEQGVIFDNLRLLGRRIGLTPIEIRLLAFRVMFRLDAGLEALMEKMFHGWTDLSFQRRLGRILGETESAIEQAISNQSVLSKTQLLVVATTLANTFLEKTALPHGLINTLIRPHRTVSSLMKFLLSPATTGTLRVANYPHLDKEIRLTTAYLRMTSSKHRKGVHVLLHGPSGTGKTELAKALCLELGWKLYALSSDIGGRGPNDGGQRLHGLATAQFVLGRSRKSAILFDEIDDVVSGDARDWEKPILTKQFLNQFLEEAPVPVFWITNHPGRLDPAYLRRFDISIAVTNPPRSVRHEMLRQACAGLAVRSTWIEQQAGIERLSPALITRMAKVARLSATARGQSTLDESGFTHAFDLLRDQHFRVNDRNIDVVEDCSLLDYDLGVINATLDPVALAKQLRSLGGGRLLFHGVPGSGKSAYARALAQEIDRPLLPRLASDLLSPLLGETEQNIRKMFEQARRDEGMLLIDEVDSFLQSRERAVRSWEVAQVNEFLTQLERFRGIVVCTTNFIDNLDAAAMRRFDAKVEFRPLRIEQRQALFRQLCQRVGLDPKQGDGLNAERQLVALDTLTPGDFATVARQLRLSTASPVAAQIVSALAEEQRYKPSASGRSIGFVR